MQKQFKLLDDQLDLNNLIRIPDPIPKPANSFFRALSISLFSTHNQSQFVKSIMKQTLQANCQAYQNTLLKKKKKYQIAFPIISQSSQLVKKYVNDKQMLETYAQSPDLQCFQNDNYQLAAFTFNRRVSIFYLNKDGYLNQTLISCCRNKTGKKILLAKVNKRYFAIQKQLTRSITSFIRQHLLSNIITQIINQKSDKQNAKVHFSAYDQIIINSHKKFPKIHKKSLSQCGDIVNKLEQFRSGYVEQLDKNFHTNIKNNYDSIQNRSHQQQPKNLIDRELDFSDKQNQNSQLNNKQQNNKVSSLQNIQTMKINEQDQKKEQITNQVKENQKTQQKTVINQIQQKTQTQQKTQNQQTKNVQSTQIAYNYNNQYQQGVQSDYTQLQNYYQQNPYMYSGYPMNQYYPQQYANYYGMQQMMYDPHYYNYYQHQQPQQQTYTYTQPQELVNNNRYRGKLKFFDSNGKYGFLIVQGIKNDLFVHFDDLSKAGMTKQYLQTHSGTTELWFEFTYYQYEGKNKKAKKAIDLQLLTEL